MLVTPSSMITSVSFVQDLNADWFIFPGILMLDKLEHPSKAFSPMSVKDLGSVIWFNAVHPLKAFFPTPETPSHRVTVVREVQFANASLPMVMTLPGIVMLVRVVFPWNA